MKLESASFESVDNEDQLKESASEIIKNLDKEKIPQKNESKLKFLTRVFALAAVFASTSANAESKSSEQEELDNFLNSELVSYGIEYQDNGRGFESESDIESRYFNDYDQELISIDATDILKEQFNTRDDPSPEMTFEVQLNNGADFEDAFKQLKEADGSDLDPIPLIDDSREIGDLKSLYDTTLQVQRINNLIESGKITEPENTIFIDRVFETESEIIGSINRSIKHLANELSTIEDGKYKEQVEQIVSSVDDIKDGEDSEKIEKLTNAETELISLLESEFSE